MTQNNPFPDSGLDTIADNLVVAFHYKLTNDDGEVIDDSFDDEPIVYIHGAGGIVPGLERELVGKKVGDRLQVVVKPEDAYGLPSGQEPEKVSINEFPDDFPLMPGYPVPVETESGEFLLLHIAEVDDDYVYLSLDHPLAGETLHFDIEILGIREATEEELEHGHPHGLHGDSGHDFDEEE